MKKLFVLAAAILFAGSMQAEVFYTKKLTENLTLIEGAVKNGGSGISGTNVVLTGTLTLTNTTSTAWSVGYWTNSVAGVGTNGVYVRMVYTPAGTTNIYYSLYQ